MDAAHQSTPANARDQRMRVLLEAPMRPKVLKLATLRKLAGLNLFVMLARMSTGLFSLPGYEEGSVLRPRPSLLMQGWPRPFVSVLDFIAPLAHPGRG